MTATTRPPAKPIQQMRILFASFCLAIAFISVVVIVLGETGHDDPPTVASSAAVTVAGVAALAASRLVAPRLDGSTDGRLVASYRSRFLLRMAFAESTVLVGLAISRAFGPWWVYFVALPFTAVGFALAAPTTRNLERDQAGLRAEGCHRPLAALLGAGPTGPIV